MREQMVEQIVMGSDLTAVFYFYFSVLQLFYTIQKMGNQIALCKGRNMVTQSLTATNQDHTSSSVNSQISTLPRKPKAFRPKKLPPVKTMKDLQPRLCSLNTVQLQQQLLDRVLAKATSMAQTSHALEGCLNLVQRQIKGENRDVLAFLEEEIDLWVQEKSQRGVQVCTDKIDRGKLFKRLNINLASFIRKKDENVKDYYDFKEVLGQGSYGKVYRAICKRTHEARAIKVLKRKTTNKERQKSFLSQFDLLSELDHPNIVKLYEIYFHKGYYYIVMDFCKGGSLIDLIKKNKSFSQQKLAHLMKQLLSVLAYLHSKDIVHRDIKLDNIVVMSKEGMDGFYSIKIIDFGLAIRVGRAKRVPAGTRHYMSPEAFKAVQNPKSDVWSAGICLYLLFAGSFPFDGNSGNEIMEAVNSSIVTFSGKKWGRVSKQAKNLILDMLEKRVDRRVSASNALKKNWFTKTDISRATINYDLSDLKMLEKYQRGNNFISVIENYLSLSQISQLERDRLGHVFKAIDTNNDGVIEAAELIIVCQNHLGPDFDMTKLLSEIDSNNSGRIDFNQFLVAMYSRKQLFLEESLKQAFNFYDMNHDGYLQRKELLRLLQGCQHQQIEYLLQQLDKDGDAKISEGEFVDYVKRHLVTKQT